MLNSMLVFVTLLVSVCLWGTSYSLLEPYEVALKYNSNTHFLEGDKVYGADGLGGRHFTGLGVDFAKFYAGMHQINMGAGGDDANITAKCGPDFQGDKLSGGLTMNLAVSLQYKLMPTPKSLSSIYKDYGGQEAHKIILRKIVRSTVRDKAADFGIRNWYTNRSGIGDAMKIALTTDLAPFHVVVHGFQLISIGVPKLVQKAIEDTAVAYQTIEQQKNEKDAQDVQSATTVLKAIVENQQIVIKEIGAANATRQLAAAEATALKLTVAEEANVYKQVSTELGFNNDELLAYLWMRAIKTNVKASSLVNVLKPKLIQG